MASVGVTMVALSIAALVVAFVVDNLITKGNISNLLVGYYQLSIGHKLVLVMPELFWACQNDNAYLTA